MGCVKSQSQTQVAGKDVANGGADCAAAVAQAQPTDARYANGSLRRCRYKTADHNGHCPPEHVSNKVTSISYTEYCICHRLKKEGKGYNLPSSSIIYCELYIKNIKIKLLLLCI